MAKRVEKGTVLGDRFRLVELIGGGGMGSVYAAYDLDQGYRVAVKVLNPRLARRTEFRERFLSESRMATSIPHPHILTVYDHGEDDGWHYLAMRLVETDLAALLSREGRLDPTRALCRPFKEARPYPRPATNREVAAEVFLSVDTVKGHLRVLFDKLGVGDFPQNEKRLRLVERAFETGS